MVVIQGLVGWYNPDIEAQIADKPQTYTIFQGLVVNRKKEMARLNKNDWLKTGLQIIGEQGAEALTINSLTNRLGVTKGSFYHHFQNYQDFKESLLNFFEEDGTSQVIRLVEIASTPLAKLESLLDITSEGWPRLEFAIRAWALQDKLVQDYQKRIDHRRLAYLQEVVQSLGINGEQARIIAQLLYTIYVGSRQITPPIQGEQLSQLYREIMKFYRLV